jgi:aldose 1-epimerase
MAGGAEIGVFGRLPDGRPVDRVALRAGALSVSVLTLGAILQDVRLAWVGWPLVLGAPALGAYLGPMGYFGAVVGPVANRISGAAVTIAGRRHALVANEGGRTTLHGGPLGTHARPWRIAAADAASVTLALDLPDGDEGFPGNRALAATYAIDDDAGLTVTLAATTDAATPLNLAPHPYWNLDGSGTVVGHRLRIAADRYLPTRDCIPDGPPAPVSGVFDLRAGRAVAPDDAWDHNFCLSDRQQARRPVAWLTGRSGLTLAVETTEPGLQVHAAAGMSTAPWAGHGGVPYGPRGGIALEPQGWPDAPNRADFPPVILQPGGRAVQQTRFALSRAAQSR